MAEPVFPYARCVEDVRIKITPEDFQVREILGFKASGAGEHLLLEVEKTALTTHELIDQLAQQVGIQPRQVGYCGLKDKQAVTTQFVSLHLPGVRRIPDLTTDDRFRILNADWHDKKLRIGIHQGNRFEIVMRGDAIGRTDLAPLLELIRSHGFANYFGAQRFGRAQDNVDQALKTLGNRRKRLGRTRKSLYLSALRSELFNRILAARIGAGFWLQPMPGDLLMLDGSHSVFNADIDDEILRRYTDLDIHSALSLYGSGRSRIDGEAARLEREVLQESPDLVSCLHDQAVKLDYRANRTRADDLVVEQYTDHAVLRVSLARGVYLTTLLDHLFARVQQGGLIQVDADA